MFTRCLTCHAPFGDNEVLEHFPHGRRVAYDPERGRLWAICGLCRSWTLAPFEERWEALEELERIVTDRARLLSRTDRIALLRHDGLEIVRVGDAGLEEEAWWRYGRELRERRRTVRRLTLVGSVAAGAAIWGGWATGGLGFLGAWILWDVLGDRVPEKLVDAARWLRFGGAAWRGNERCESCGRVFESLPFDARDRLVIVPGDGGARKRVRQPCPRCGSRRGEGRRTGGLVLTGPEAERTLRRVLAYHHFSGASRKRVHRASRLLERTGTGPGLDRAVLREGRPLAEIGRTGAVALEIAANEEAERRLLEMELAELEAAWRREEEIASIVDGELTPVPLLESLRRKVARREG